MSEEREEQSVGYVERAFLRKYEFCKILMAAGHGAHASNPSLRKCGNRIKSSKPSPAAVVVHVFNPRMQRQADFCEFFQAG